MLRLGVAPRDLHHELRTGIGNGTLLASVGTMPISSGPTGVGRCVLCDRDLWEVDRYVRGESVAICDACVMASHRVVVEAAQGQRELALPPRVSGVEVGDPNAPAAITHAFQVVFDDAAQGRAEHLEDGRRVVTYMETVETGVLPGSVHTVRVDRIRFADADSADVRFAIVLEAGTAGFGFEGRAVRRDGRWLVSRDTFAQRVAGIGIQLPPQE